MTSSKVRFCIMTVAVLLVFAGFASAQGGSPKVVFMKGGTPDVGATVNFIMKSGPKGSATTGPGGVLGLDSILSSSKPHTQVEVEECTMDGTLFVAEQGAQNQVPCKKRRRLIAFWLDETGTVTVSEVTMTAGGSRGDAPMGVPVTVELDTLFGGALFGGSTAPDEYITEASDCSESGDTCTHSHNTWKVNIEGAILFPIGSGTFSVGPVFGIAYRGDLRDSISYPSEGGTEVESDHLRKNNLFVGIRGVAKLGDHFRVFLEVGPSVDSLRDTYTDVYPSGSYQDVYSQSAVSPEEAVGISARLTPMVWLTVKYERQDDRFDRESGSGESDPVFREFVFHENGIVGGLTFLFGGNK